MSGGLFGRLESELTVREKNPGLSMADVLELPDDTRRLITWLIRQKMASWSDAVSFLECDDATAGVLLGDLVQRGYVRDFEMRGVRCLQVRLAPKRGRTLSAGLWQALDTKVGG